jgi:processive 1,2-diacylglycerol beta-glucosyltransferase
MINRVLILSASAGAGHVRAAEALQHAFLQNNLAREVLHIDALQYTTAAFRNIYSKAYIHMVNGAPTVLGWLYDSADQPWKDEKRRLTIDRLNVRRLIKLINDYQPDFVVCTHFLPAEIISWLLCTGRIYTRHAVVITDFDAHAMWLCHHYTKYFVALEETRQHLAQLGFAPQHTVVSGIPIAPEFCEQKDKVLTRIKLGLKPDRTTLLISAGGFGVGPMESILKNLLAVHHPLQVIAICGRNDRLKRRVEQLSAGLPPDGNLHVHPIGYTKNMDEYMSASDLLLGKPGGLTTSEALAKGLGLVIVKPIPGQEERNSDHLLEQGVAIRCNNLPALAYKIDALLDDPHRLESMQKNALRLSKPAAALTIANTLSKSFDQDDRAHTVNAGHACPVKRPNSWRRAVESVHAPEGSARDSLSSNKQRPIAH